MVKTQGNVDGALSDLLAARRLLIRHLVRKFGSLPTDIASRIRTTCDLEQLDAWLLAILDAGSFADIGLTTTATGHTLGAVDTSSRREEGQEDGLFAGRNFAAESAARRATRSTSFGTIDGLVRIDQLPKSREAVVQRLRATKEIMWQSWRYARLDDVVADMNTGALFGVLWSCFGVPLGMHDNWKSSIAYYFDVQVEPARLGHAGVAPVRWMLRASDWKSAPRIELSMDSRGPDDHLEVGDDVYPENLGLYVLSFFEGFVRGYLASGPLVDFELAYNYRYGRRAKYGVRGGRAFDDRETFVEPDVDSDCSDDEAPGCDDRRVLRSNFERGALETRQSTLIRLLERKLLGPLTGTIASRILSTSDERQLDRWLGQLPDAHTLTDVGLDDARVPESIDRPREISAADRVLSDYARGAIDARRSALIRMLERQLGDLPTDLAARIRATRDPLQLDLWLDAVIDARPLVEVGLA